jgi:hypothetical protein
MTKLKSNQSSSKNSAQGRILVDEDKMKQLIENSYRSKLNENILNGDFNTFYDNLLDLVEQSKEVKPIFRRFSQPWYDQECYIFKGELNLKKRFC